MRKIHRVFIANRGEIARRIARGAQGLGIESAALYSGDAPPAFLEGLVQEFVRVPEESPAVYLNAELMVKLALETGCDAVHPGFGFLSENARFAAMVEEAGLTWIGPSSSAISEMASKAAAREIAKNHGVPVVPGIERLNVLEDGSHLDTVRAFVRQHGFPILLKAALGGGGKGMRVVREDAELEEAIRRAQSEAINAFGDGSLIVERYVEYPRHVEVQILGDSHGHIYALGDRDCSVQRRHQKIIEEAPAPALTPETREAMHAAAIRLARSVRYQSAGTVEFLVDWSPDRRHLQEQAFYFLEMNTRLQVEHPVTEQIFQEDLVAWQFKIAQGASIRDRLNLVPQGHSIELRLYAEDAEQRFLPAPGPVYGFSPAQLPGIRWEIGIDPIDEITARFDPMIAKLVATGTDRDQAIERLIQALQQTVLAIPTSNIGFLLGVLRHKAFQADQPTTRFIEEHQDELLSERSRLREHWEPWALRIMKQLHAPSGVAPETIDVTNITRYVFQRQARDTTHLSCHLSQHQAIAVPRRYRGRHSIVGKGLVAIEGRWQSFTYCQTQRDGAFIQWINLEGQAFLREERPDDLLAASKGGSQGQNLVAPVPGKVVKVLIEAGSKVRERQTVVILESMKMEFEVQASRSGIIQDVLVQAGQQVQADELLAHWRGED
jgi:geranyl-CoA carboxylase alpha subunit